MEPCAVTMATVAMATSIFFLSVARERIYVDAPPKRWKCVKGMK